MPGARLGSVQRSLRSRRRNAADKNTWRRGLRVAAYVYACVYECVRVCVCVCGVVVVSICKAAGSSGRDIGPMQMREAGLFWGSASLPRSWGQRCQAQLDQQQQLGE